MSSRSIPALALTMCLGAAVAAPPDPADPRQGAAVSRPAPADAGASAAARSVPGAAVADPGVGDWRLANRRVLEAGGWRVLLRESQAASAPASGHHRH